MPSVANQLKVATGVGAAPVNTFLAFDKPRPFLILFFIKFEIKGIFNKISNFF